MFLTHEQTPNNLEYILLIPVTVNVPLKELFAIPVGLLELAILIISTLDPTFMKVVNKFFPEISSVDITEITHQKFHGTGGYSSSCSLTGISVTT